MRRSRLLIVIPAVGALVFTGLAPASADPGDRNRKVSAEIVRIDDDARVNDRGRIRVEALYRCDGNGDRIETNVTLRQRDARYEGEVDGGLNCDGKKHRQVVRLEKESRDRVRNGDAKVTWEYTAGRRSLDKERDTVDVRGAGRGK